MSDPRLLPAARRAARRRLRLRLRRAARAARPRRGAALPVLLTAMVGVTLLSAGAFTASRETFRNGRNALVEQRALSVAEFGLNERLSDWDTRLNLPPSMGGIVVGAVDSTSRFTVANDTARIRITRLTPFTYHVESVGRASIPQPQLQAVRSVSALVRLAYPEIRPRGALTAAGDVRISGNATVDGTDGLPPGWTPSECLPLRGPNLPAVAMPPGRSYQQQGSSAVIGGRIEDPAAADSNTYVRFGTVHWNELVQNANIRINGGNPNPRPAVLPNGDCHFNDELNWGEPDRIDPVFARCRTYFPIVYSDGNLQLNGQNRGQGILLVNGDLRINGSFKWVGLIVVRDDVDAGNGNADVIGGIMAANLRLDGGQNASVNGGMELRYSRCAVEAVLRGSAALVRVRDRGWAQVF